MPLLPVLLRSAEPPVDLTSLYPYLPLPPPQLPSPGLLRTQVGRQDHVHALLRTTQSAWLPIFVVGCTLAVVSCCPCSSCMSSCGCKTSHRCFS